VTAIRVENLSQFYGHFAALTDVSFTVAAGERRAVIGPNGAGKTTLFNIIAGQRSPSSGEIYINGTPTKGLRPDQLWTRGLTRTFQRSQLFQKLTVWENVELACAAHYRRRGMRLRRPAALDTDIIETLQKVRLSHAHTVLVSNLAYGEQRQLELALALAGRPKILLLDEPTAGMSPVETDAMLSLMAGLPHEITILIVEHDMDVVFSIADRITVLHLGKMLAEGSPSEIEADEQVSAVYMGRRRSESR
jgi:branched-chain amino acid transport system ATP-binding protein